MAVADEIPVDTARRRRRRVALVLALASVLLGSGIMMDSLLNNREEETAWTTDTVFPRITRLMSKPHGITVPIGKRANEAGRGGPEDPGPYIEEANDRWLLADGQMPIDGLMRTAFNLPTHMPAPGKGIGSPPAGLGGPPGGGGGGGGDGGLVLSCEKDAPALEKLTGKKCPETGSEPAPTETAGTPEDGGLTILPIVSSPIAGGGGSAVVYPTVPTLPAGGPADSPPNEGNPGMPPVTPVSVVPEPQSWAMMIAGFFLAGFVIRGSARRTRQVVANVR